MIKLKERDEQLRIVNHMYEQNQTKMQDIKTKLKLNQKCLLLRGMSRFKFSKSIKCLLRGMSRFKFSKSIKCLLLRHKVPPLMVHSNLDRSSGVITNKVNVKMTSDRARPDAARTIRTVASVSSPQSPHLGRLSWQPISVGVVRRQGNVLGVWF